MNIDTDKKFDFYRCKKCGKQFIAEEDKCPHCAWKRALIFECIKLAAMWGGILLMYYSSKP